MSSKQLYLRLLRYILPYWRVFTLSILSTIAVAATEPALPALLKPMLDGSFVSRDQTLIKLVPLLLVGLFLLRGIFTFISNYTVNWVSTRLVMDLRNLMFHKLITLPTPYYDNASSGSVIANVAFNVNQVTAAGTNVITVLVRDSFTILGLLGWMLYINWKLTLIALVMGPLIALTVRLFSGRLRKMSRSLQNSMGDITHVLDETLDGHKVVKIFGGQDYEGRRFHEAANRNRLFSMKYTIAAGANVPLVQLLAAIALALIVYIATLQSSANQTTVGGFVSFITAMLMLLAPIKRLTGVSESLQRGLAAAEIVFDLLDRESEPDNGTQEIARAKGALELQNICLRYEENTAWVLKDISLKIAPGETVALVGQSGSGKTSLVNLIPRFYHPTSGQILLDGYDIETIRLANLRDNIAFVSQDVVLFNDTIAANIAYGRQAKASEADIIAAAEAAHAMEFIREMPEGLQTWVGENGVKLSGGQRQRIAIARAILKNAPILILDEATSALDTQSERHVQAALENLMQNRTTIVIAHRLSTIEKADRIVVMQKGSIVEIGPHRELLDMNGVYANLYRIQFALDSTRPSPDI
ncbi:lipid A export permease/ATP-binding protein MsbA [Sulfuricella sp.]|uniref:lipid A export permease/ATP-binding protein MsbA n=1 Tax=Sulfuricella sp. TaxID=2099377 RepID=UPI002CD39CD2|nr:lipid A export permease/ATP-binding protein MsbA [Sulfuricella sp.]HUX65220.1 lipid A export permease/ATP-binding protein MsbA [Sulfuricella sp.]